MWMLEVTVPEDLEEVIDGLVGEPNFLIQCWGEKVGDSKLKMTYAFRGEVYARKAESLIAGVVGAEGLKVWNQPGDGTESQHTNEALSTRISNGDVDAAEQWLAGHQGTFLKDGWWYQKFPSGKKRRMALGENITQNQAIALTSEK
jgi:hypothetical protein